MVPGDPSSAAFLAAAALIVPGSEITIEGVLVNPTRTGFYTTLREMGADVAFLNEREEGGEPIADIRVRHSHAEGRARAARARAQHDRRVSRCWPASRPTPTGETRMEGLAELKVKESDRLAATAAGLVANGVAARVEGDTLIVQRRRGVRGGGTVATHLDHRIAMAFLTLGLGADRPVTVDDAAMIATSFPRVPRPDGAGLGATVREPRRGAPAGMIIAIDGPAASGKGTLAKRIAAHFGLHHLDTGLLYRAVARDVQRNGGRARGCGGGRRRGRAQLDPATLDDPGPARPGRRRGGLDRRPHPAGAGRPAASSSATSPPGRPGAVLDGRDIGTVVCPDADVKIFVTATPGGAGRRRHLEMQGRGEAATYEAVLADIRRRDERDAGREAAPMRPAADAFLLDTSNLDIEAAFDTAVGVISRKVGQRGRA